MKRLGAGNRPSVAGDAGGWPPRGRRVPPGLADPPVLTPRPGPAPRINGPRFSASARFTPSSSRYRPPATARSATRRRGCPTGCAVDAATGQITGRLERPGTHNVVLEVSNAQRKGPPPVPDRLRRHLALTPHMGWNSWYIWENRVTDKIMRDAADAMVAPA